MLDSKVKILAVSFLLVCSFSSSQTVVQWYNINGEF